MALRNALFDFSLCSGFFITATACISSTAMVVTTWGEESLAAAQGGGGANEGRSAATARPVPDRRGAAMAMSHYRPAGRLFEELDHGK